MLTITPNAIAGSATPLLNPILLSSLSLVFPAQREQIRVSHAGRRRTPKKGPLGHSLPPEEHGEEYILNCPFCDDSGRRMQINYTYDPSHSNHHWYCYHEGCQKNPAHRVELANRIQAAWLAAKQQLANGLLPPAMLSVVVEDDSTDVIPQLPEGMVQLWSLPPDHPARLYVAGRQFDHIGLSHRVGYSEYSCVPSPGFQHRIIIPFYRPTSDDHIELLGWQARSLEANPASPKYLTMAGMHKSRLLYTYPTGIAPSDRLIVAEGVTDVWMLGRDAVAILGKTASPHQQKLIVDAARSRKAVLVALDADAETEALDLIRRLQGALRSTGTSIPVVRCRPPRGYSDFGSCNSFQVSRAIDDAMAVAASTTVSYPASPRPSAPDKSSDAPRTRKELAERLVSIATDERPVDAEARVTELGMAALLNVIEEPLLPILAEIERVGLRVDRTRLNEITAANPDLQTKAASLVAALFPQTGRVHATLDVLGARTGRITTRRFNLQSLDRPLRSAIVADEDRKLICADFSQFEWRLAAAICGDATLLNWCADPSIDLYSEVASLTQGICREAVTPQARDHVKQLMMKFLYSAKNYDSNDDLFWQFLVDQFLGLVAWREQHVAQAYQAGFVRTLTGRMIAVDRNDNPDTFFSRAVNYMIQGAAADIFKFSLASVRRQLPAEIRILLPHVDAILLDAPHEMVSDVIPKLRAAMEAPPAGCPIKFPCKIQCGANWGEASGC